MVILNFQSKKLCTKELRLEASKERAVKRDQATAAAVRPRDLRRAIREERSNSFWCESRLASAKFLAFAHSFCYQAVGPWHNNRRPSIDTRTEGRKSSSPQTHSHIQHASSLGVRASVGEKREPVGVADSGAGWTRANNCRASMKKTKPAPNWTKSHLSRAIRAPRSASQ